MILCAACKFANTETAEMARQRLSELIYSHTRIVATTVKDTKRIERIRRLVWNREMFLSYRQNCQDGIESLYIYVSFIQRTFRLLVLLHFLAFSHSKLTICDNFFTINLYRNLYK